MLTEDEPECAVAANEAKASPSAGACHSAFWCISQISVEERVLFWVHRDAEKGNSGDQKPGTWTLQRMTGGAGNVWP